ncbi:Stress response kinase A [compost metagenome]
MFKVWNRQSNPDIGAQFQLLKALYERGIAVSRPLGWGKDTSGNQVLLMSFDGAPVRTADTAKMEALARILARIHRVTAEELADAGLPKYSFTDYFFPGIEEYADISQALMPLVQLAQLNQEAVIHGDYHMSNIVEENGRYTVIDWTNGQAGDARYDFAWTDLLMHLYTPEPFARVFRLAYLAENRIPLIELEKFEALACLRWLILQRRGSVPLQADTIPHMRGIIGGNPYLREALEQLLGGAVNANK